MSADEARDMIEYSIVDAPCEVKYYMCDSCGHVFSVVDVDGFMHTWEDLEDDLVDTI